MKTADPIQLEVRGYNIIINGRRNYDLHSCSLYPYKHALIFTNKFKQYASCSCSSKFFTNLRNDKINDKQTIKTRPRTIKTNNSRLYPKTSNKLKNHLNT